MVLMLLMIDTVGGWNVGWLLCRDEGGVQMKEPCKVDVSLRHGP